MTTFHDPPQSRRATRQSERKQAADEQPPVEGFTTFPSPETEQGDVGATQIDSRDESTADESTADAAGETDAAAVVPPAPSSSRPSNEAAYRAAPPPLPQTQNSALAPPAAPMTSIDEPSADSERPLTRRELRELRARGEAAVESSAPQPITIEQVMPAYIEPPALVDPLAVVPEAASVDAAPEDALSAFESLLASADGSPKDAPATDSPRSPLINPRDDAGWTTPLAAEQASAEASPAPQSSHQTASAAKSSSPLANLLGFGTDRSGVSAGEALSEAQPAAVDVSQMTNLNNARAEFDEQARKRLDGQLPGVAGIPAPASSALSPELSVDASGIKLIPAGHWSRQAVAKETPTDSVIPRTISSGTSATSALVLPAIPFAKDIRGPLNSRGEAMLTGSIELPSSLSASGVSDRFDNTDIDSLLDLNDSDMVSTDSAPVRAVKAVSTFSNQSVTQTQKPKGTRALTVLLISASSMAVVVVGLLVAAFAFNML